MRIAIGIDVAKDVHWATAIDDQGATLLDRSVANTPAELARLIDDLAALDGIRTVGVDVCGGIATLLCAMLLQAGECVVHVPGLAVNRARQGTTGGESKTDPRDARVIADQVRTRRDLRPLEPDDEATAELRLLVSRRRELVTDQTRRLARLHELLVAIHPGLERRLDLTTKAALCLLTRYVTPAQIRRAGRARMLRFLRACPHVRQPEALADRALEAAREQSLSLPGERLTAHFCRETAADALQSRQRILDVDRQIEERVRLHPDAALIRSLPGMGVTLTAEFLVEVGSLARFHSPDALAAAAGIAPVLRQSGKIRYLQRPRGGNKALKRVFYQAAFCALQQPDSRAFYDRKRRQGKRHHQAVIALARRRVNVLWAMLRDRQPYRCQLPRAA
ncbi:MAG: IS110 family transposase [Solirubrobacterales bacterium]